MSDEKRLVEESASEAASVPQDEARDGTARDEKPAEKHLTQTIIPVEMPELLDKVQDMKDAGYRLGQLCAAKAGGAFHLLYSFDKDCTLTNLKLAVKEDEAIPSITGVYWPAFIYENEIQDLFGFQFKHLALNYNGKFFKVAEPTPWNPKSQAETT